MAKKAKKTASKKSKAKQASGTKKSSDSGTEHGKACAILAYFFPIGLIWFLVDDKMRKNDFAKFHVQQSLVMFGVWLVFYVASWVLFFIGGLVQLIGQIIVLILFILGIIYSAQGKKTELPLVGQYGKKINL